MIKDEQDPEEKMEIIDKMSPVLGKVIHSVRQFIKNETPGMMNPDYNVGEIIYLRQTKIF